MDHPLMKFSNANHFLPGALAAFLLFVVLWFAFAVAFFLTLMLVGADIFSRWAELVCVLGASILACCCVAATGRSILRRSGRTHAPDLHGDSC